MSISNFKKIYGGGLVIRVDAADGFIYDHKIHNGATIILSDAGKIGALAVDLGNMASNNGATLQIVSTADITITDSKEKLTNVSLSGIGIFNLLSVDGLIYYSDPSNAFTAKLDSIILEKGTPVAAVAATAVLTPTGAAQPTAESTVTINDQTYEWVDPLPTEGVIPINQVYVGADLKAALTNLVAAVNGTGEVGTNYTVGTKKPIGVTGAVTGTNTTATFTAVTAGKLANAYPVGQTVPAEGTSLVWSPKANLFSDGRDGTTGKAGKILFDTTYIYIATKDCTIIDASGWIKIEHKVLT